jgi:hypothetical protein
MPWEYKYDGPAETEIKSMKEGRSSDSVEYISDESGYGICVPVSGSWSVLYFHMKLA